VALLCAVFACAACQYSPDMLDRTVAYNRTVANSTNEVLLLNIVRASQRLPTYYTRLEGDAASLALTPSGSLSLPLNNPRSFESDINGGPTGAVTSTTTKAISALGNILGAVGLQASESNLLTLQTLDDQKYQNGMMTPVPVKNIQAFQDEGYQRDLLFMMFLGSVQVSSDLIDPMDAATVERCRQINAVGGLNGASFNRQLCAYIASGPYQTLFDPGRAHSWDYSFSLRSCVNNGGAVADPAPGAMVHFNNDPAREGRKGDPGDPHPEVCFQILLSDLLVLGLEVGSPVDIPAELVDAVPDAVAQNPQFRGQMIQQNYFLRETSDGVTTICRKKQQDNGFTLAFGDPTGRAVAPAPLATLMNRLGGSARPERAVASGSYPADPLSACQQKNPGMPESGAEALLATDTEAGAEDSAIKPIKLTSDKIAFSARSFEGMIYYLGEAVRYETDDNANPINFPRVLGRNPGLLGTDYVEVMFYGSSHVGSPDRAVTVSDDDGKSYSIPKSCMPNTLGETARPVACSAEYPDNESLQVLNFVNQVWGLQKESVSGPTSPLVVISPQ